MNAETIREEFESMLRGLLPELKAGAAAVAEYAALQAEKLALLAGQPGFDAAATAARDAVLLHGALAAVKAADVADARTRAAVLAGIRMAAGALA
jgi:hypothetical protein